MPQSNRLQAIKRSSFRPQKWYTLNPSNLFFAWYTLGVRRHAGVSTEAAHLQQSFEISS